jgi:hypothetical protein
MGQPQLAGAFALINDPLRRSDKFPHNSTSPVQIMANKFGRMMETTLNTEHPYHVIVYTQVRPRRPTGVDVTRAETKPFVRNSTSPGIKSGPGCPFHSSEKCEGSNEIVSVAQIISKSYTSPYRQGRYPTYRPWSGMHYVSHRSDRVNLFR